MTSSSGRLADIGDVGWYCLPMVRVNSSERLCLGHPFLKHHVVREIQRRRSSLVGKSAQTSAECTKLIMISRVPGYGHLEYLVPGLSCESQHVTLNSFCWVMFNDVA